MAPTGRRVSIIVSGAVRVVDVKIAEERSVADLAALPQQFHSAGAAREVDGTSLLTRRARAAADRPCDYTVIT